MLPVLNGVSAKGKMSTDCVTVQRLDGEAVGRQLRAGARSAWRRRCDRRDQYGLRRRRLSSSTSPTGVELDQPIELQNVQAGGQTHVRFPVRVGNGAKATIVERQTGSGAALVSSVSHLKLGDDAEIVWLIVQDQPENATHLGQFNADLGKNSRSSRCSS